ncbi:OLC1v1016782C3 [Oldenlandia corymbosa var. corymbosa]|uniref:OLC1v1016782C3 n=1 Tax=Oldenlandia corymbosa var. corymbosa TaxID=529605 RepID=A0AAV1E7Y6_OLDCO|nr:OLC1v1016782C3 [Oldenlandia corymbosa var. corymbosa]
METELVLASINAGISCWDLRSGAAQHAHFRSASSTPAHGLTSIDFADGNRVIAATHVREAKKSSGSVLYWTWNKHEPEVKSFLFEPILALVSHSEAGYIVGGSKSGKIYIWEVSTGNLLTKWDAHLRAVTCLVFSDDKSLLISGSEEGGVRVWSLFMIFNEVQREQAKYIYEYSFSEHSLKVTDIAVGYGGCNAVILSSSEDHTCKIWSLSGRKLLRSVKFPSIIDAVALDPVEHVFFAGGRDGKIYEAALSAQVKLHHSYGEHIIRSSSEHSKAITCLKLSLDGRLLISGSEDGMVRVWDTKTLHIIRVFRHDAKGPVSNVLVISQPLPRTSVTSQAVSSRRHELKPLKMSSDSPHENVKASLKSDDHTDYSNICVQTLLQKQIKELQQQGSSAANGMETERVKLELKETQQMNQQWKRKFDDLYGLYVSEIMEGST